MAGTHRLDLTTRLRAPFSGHESSAHHCDLGPYLDSTLNCFDGPVDYDGNGLEILGHDECLRLLATMPVGRIGVTIRALPVILPVNFALDGDRVIVRSVAGSKLTLAMAGAVVALEVDQFDFMDHSGWSVLAQGRSKVITDSCEIERAMTLRLRAWASEQADRFIAVDLEVVSGRRVEPWDRLLAVATTSHAATTGST